MTTDPNVFIIESLNFEDEENNRYEGKFISNILEMNEKHPKYYYIRTECELLKIIETFNKSNCRYLHLSCHGNGQEMATTLDNISFPRLGSIFRPYLRKKRLFVSACEMVNDELAKAIMPGSGCYSIIGPEENVTFSDAAIIWASFYHLMFHENRDKMGKQVIKEKLESLVKLFGVSLNFYCFNGRNKCGFDSIKITP